MNRSRRLLTGLFAAGLPFLAVLPVTGLAATLEKRLAGLAGEAGRVLAFEEQRASGLTREPVTVRGRLEWDPEAEILTKWVDEPRPARLAITPTQLEAQAGQGRTRRMPLDRRPELAALLGGIRALLSGDVAALESTFTADYLEGEDAAWVLRLVPLDPGLAERLSLLEVRGEGDEVRTIDTLRGDGARERMTLLAESASEADSQSALDTAGEADEAQESGASRDDAP